MHRRVARLGGADRRRVAVGSGRLWRTGGRVQPQHALDRFEEALAGPRDGVIAALGELQRVEPAAAERYQVQLWPVGRLRK